MFGFSSISRKVLFTLGAVTLLGLTGCQTTKSNIAQTGPLMVGPGAQTALGTVKKDYTYNSDIYLDIAVPVFNPGLPLNDRGEVDYEEVDEQQIWPQLRRAEAKRFAIQTKKALENTGAFGAVSVVPSPNASADVFVLGSVDFSDSEFVKVTATVVDSTGDIWGNKQFEHQVSKGFFRDAKNKDKNPYEPIFKQIGDYVFDLLVKQSEQEKVTIKETTKVRYAQLYSPETYSKYIEQKLVRGRNGIQDHYRFNLVGAPSENDRMLSRIEVLKTQDQMFVDGLQEQYMAFDAETVESYRTWQRETLPEAVAAREAKSERLKSGILAGVLAVGAVLLDKNSGSTAGAVGKTVGALASAYFIKDTLDKNAELKVHKASLDEMGENLDINLSPSVMEFDNKTVELTGTAGEQYEQWKSHLRKIYEVESAQAQGNNL
ncbi:hypothetical protein ACSLBF_17730 (plasmid) [Pseudoalteromonas sp. T1lg65]|uniref:hypothetical protein n=1 Tax=Pseudoalteromonas sp. T1lg65 TaxID=2077101 RepID=UPI003F794E12